MKFVWYEVVQKTFESTWHTWALAFWGGTTAACWAICTLLKHGHLGKLLVQSKTCKDFTVKSWCKDWKVLIAALEAAEAAFRSANATWLFDLRECFSFFCDAGYCDFGWLTLIYRVSDICTYSQTEQLYAYWRGCLTVNLNEVYIHFWNTSHLLPWIIGSHWVWTVGQSVLGCGWIEIIPTCLVIAYESCAITFLYSNMIAGHHSSL